jgi:uncharacterized membrane protein required for colicin V production
MLLSFILAALSVVSLVKNFFVNFNLSDSGWKTALIAVLIVICLLCAATGYSESYTVRDIKAQLLTPLSSEEIANLQAQIPIKTNISIMSNVIGYAAYLISAVLIGKIKKNKLRQIEKNKESRWANRKA